MTVVGDVCRACLKAIVDASEELRLLSEVSAYMFTYCTSLEISRDDALPKSLCRNCYDLLEPFYDFKRRCIESSHALLGCTQEKDTFRPRVAIKEEDILIENLRNESRPLLNNGEIDKKPKVDYLQFHSEASHKLNSDKINSGNKSTNVKKKIQKTVVRSKFKVNQLGKYVLRYSCSICSKKFAHVESLEEHKLAHEGFKKEHICTVCNKNFKNWLTLQGHNDSVHNVSQRRFECECGKVLKSQKMLKYHQKNHHVSPKKYVCHVCGKVYASHNLQAHLETHNEKTERNFECSVCGGKFARKVHLQSHMSHHKERRLVCDVCAYACRDKSAMRCHMVTHMAVKPHPCDVCHKRFGKRSFLVEHRRVHTGERPFACDMCPMRFISKQRMAMHRRTHTGDKRYVCQVCDHAFVQSGTYKRHMRGHHKRTEAVAVPETARGAQTDVR